jgi:ABC-type polar amino acid transport system ATPase subunit
MNDHVFLGEREHWGQNLPFGLSQSDRRHHLYVIGKSGSGKTTLLRNLILQDIEPAAIAVVSRADKAR